MSARQAARPCGRCGDERDSHKPYSPGGRPGYCAACGCYQYVPQRPWAQFLAWFRKAPAPIPVDVVRARPVLFPFPDRAVDDDRTQLGFRAAPYVGAVDEARLRVPRPRRGGSR